MDVPAADDVIEMSNPFAMVCSVSSADPAFGRVDARGERTLFNGRDCKLPRQPRRLSVI